MKPTGLSIAKSTELMNVSADPDGEPIMAEIGLWNIRWELAPTDSDYKELVQAAYRIIVYRNGQNVYDTDRVDGYETSCRIVNPPEKMEADDSLILTLTLWDGDDFITETIEEDL